MAYRRAFRIPAFAELPKRSPLGNPDSDKREAFALRRILRGSNSVHHANHNNHSSDEISLDVIEHILYYVININTYTVAKTNN